MLNICAKFHETLTFTFREITTSVTNKRTNQPTNKQTRVILAEVIRTRNVTHDLNVELEKLSEVGWNVTHNNEHDPVVRELTEYQRKHRQ